MKEIIKLWIFVATVLTLTSCSMNKRIAKCKDLIVQVTDTVTNTVVEVSEIETFVDIPYYITADTSAWVKALIECDSIGNARIKELTQNKGNRSSVKASIQNNVLTAQSNCEAITDSLKAVIKNTTTTKLETKIVKQPCPEHILSWWAKFKINFGGYAIIGWLVLILFFIGRKFLKAWIKANIPFSGKFFLKRT